MKESIVRFPVLEAPPPRTIEVFLDQESPQRRERIRALLDRGETLELVEQRPDQALPIYREAYALPVSNRAKAVALSRVSRCLRKTGQTQAAAEAYEKLFESYGDLYDLASRPFRLTAGLERHDLAPAPATLEQLRDLYHELGRGRWELASEQWDYFVARLEDRLGAPSPSLAESEYAQHLALARELRESFRHQGTLRTDQVYAFALTRGPLPCQTFYTALPSAADLLIGFAADLDWIRAVLLAESRMQTAAEPSSTVELKSASRDPAAEQPGSVRTAFRSLFPFWELSLSPPRATGRLEALVYGGVTLLVLSVLGLGVFLLVRDAAREAEVGRLRADFVSGVSHELKTPLTLIRLYGETLLHGKGFPEEERKDYYRIITRESERLTHLLDNVLDFSRIDRGQKQYQFEEGDLAAVVRQTVGLYGDYLRRRGFTVEVDLDTDLPPIAFDAQAISQAVLNLMDNAAKYSEASRFVAVRLRAEDSRVLLEVQDRGVGIAPAEREKIFRRFYRAPSGGRSGGHGLGLFLVQHIMEAHGGAIEVESEPGRGSRFRLVFPRLSAS
jgi:signal transduction histidine kinase